MKKILILFLFTGMFLWFDGCFSYGQNPPTPAQIPGAHTPIPATVVQCPYCHVTYTVYATGLYKCSNCGNNFEVVPSAVSTVPLQNPPPVVITPPSPVIVTPPPVVYAPPPVYYSPYYPYYPGWYGSGFSLFFGYGGGYCGHGYGHYGHGHGHHH